MPQPPASGATAGLSSSALPLATSSPPSTPPRLGGFALLPFPARLLFGTRAARRIRPGYTLVALACFSLAQLAAPAAELPPADGFLLPPGFHITCYADDSLVPNAYSLTTDHLGRIVVSGPGYIKTLIDDNADGQADRALLFSNLPYSGAQGLYADGARLLFSGDGILGVLTDANADGQADGPPQTWARLASGEHGAHAIVAGPDGDFYLVAGNESAVQELQPTANSPLTTPQCGAILRFSPDGQRRECLAHGFRNPYDLAFDPLGRLFTVDSDNERTHHLPWYIPTRLFDVGIGLHHGWLQRGWQQSWNRPPWFPDVVPYVTQFGRGSPTGLVCYRHTQFPAPYRAGLFTACWTMGRVYHVQLDRHDASVAAQVTTFLESTGASGFAPVDLEVGPHGELFIAVGGRGTRGAVYCVRYADPTATTEQQPAAAPPTTDLDRLLHAPQPLAPWSRHLWQPLAQSLGADALRAAAADPQRPLADRIRAIEILTTLFQGLSPPAAETLLANAPEPLAARCAWSCGRWSCHAPQDDAGHLASLQLLARMTRHPHPLVQRAAWEALAEHPRTVPPAPSVPAWDLAFDAPDARVRELAIHLAQQYRQRGDDSPLHATANLSSPRVRLAHARLQLTPIAIDKPAPATLLAAWNTAQHILATQSDFDLRLEALRVLQLALGDIAATTGADTPLAGYVSHLPERIPTDRRQAVGLALLPAFPSTDAQLDRELARTLALFNVELPTALDRLARLWHEHSSPVDDVHYLMVAARLAGPRSPEARAHIASAIVHLDTKLAAQGASPSRTWPDEVAATFTHLLRQDPLLGQALIQHPDFGREGHCFLVPHLVEADRPLAARRCLSKLAPPHDHRAPWSSELIDVFRLLDPAEIRPVLREQWDTHGYAPGLPQLLARDPQPQDHPRLVAALELASPAEITHLARALLALGGDGSPDDCRAAVVALRRLAQSQNELPEPVARDPAARQRWLNPQLEAANLLAQLLSRWGAASLTPPTDADQLLPLAVAARDWLHATHPHLARQAEQRSGVDLPAWRARWNDIAWDSGSANRGRDWFARLQCARCHAGNSRLGPDLRGAAARLSRDDLLLAIVDPHQQIAPTYRTSLVLTRSGQVHEGLLIYESPEGTLLQTATGETVRIGADEFLALRPGRLSLMPTGLLDPLDDQALADLYAFLRTLTP